MTATMVAGARPKPTDHPVVLRADRMVDVDKRALVEPGVVVVEGEHIRDVSPERLPDDSEVIAEFIVNEFNQTVPGLYDPEDQERGHVEVRNRLHQMDQFPLMSLTVALVSTDSVSVTHLAQLIDIAQELKEHGKGIPGSVVVGERRRPGDGRQSAA